MCGKSGVEFCEILKFMSPDNCSKLIKDCYSVPRLGSSCFIMFFCQTDYNRFVASGPVFIDKLRDCSGLFGQKNLDAGIMRWKIKVR